jgi:asparagine N-glycosylation enzyme membrane subunit Stt3
MNKIFLISAFVLLLLICGLYDAKRSRTRKATLDAIAAAPLPHLPLSFTWNWWGIILLMAVPCFALAFSMLLVFFRRCRGVNCIARLICIHRISILRVWIFALFLERPFLHP